MTEVRYCSNFKCKLWTPITSIADNGGEGLRDPMPTKTSIVGLCGCLGAAKGDCLRCGGV